MRQSSRVLLALAACCACAGLGAAQDPNWVDPNLQTEGFSASLTTVAIAGNPLGLVPVRGSMLLAGVPAAAWFAPRRRCLNITPLWHATMRF